MRGGLSFEEHDVGCGARFRYLDAGMRENSL
jgi:hypothetical protein